MKKILSAIVALAAGGALFALDIFSYVPVTGNVKSRTKTEYAITSKFGSYFRTPSSKIVTTYDENGRVITSTELTPKDLVINKITSLYDEDGKLSEQYAEDADGNLIWREVPAYDGKLKTESSVYNAAGDLRERIFYTYLDGNLIDETYYDGDGALVWKIIYTYKGRAVTEICQYGDDGVLDAKQTFSYLQDGKVDSIIYFDNFKKTSTQDIFRYNEGLSEITTYNQNRDIIKRLLIKYDSGKNVAKLSEYEITEKFGTSVNELISQVEYQYEY